MIMHIHVKISINVNIEEAVNTVQRSRNKIKKSLSDENKFSNSIDKAPFFSLNYILTRLIKLDLKFFKGIKWIFDDYAYSCKDL
jgi:hypothetical protein